MERSSSDPGEPLVALVFPVAAVAEHAAEARDDLDALHVLRALVAELRRYFEPDRRAVLDRDRLVVELVREEGWGRRGLPHVGRLVVRLAAGVFVHAMENDVARLRLRRAVREDVAKDDARPLADDAPALDAIVTRH